MDDQEVIQKLYQLAEIGIVNYKADTPFLCDAALLIEFQQLKIEAMEERIYKLEERIAIMEEGNVIIAPGANIDLMAILDSIDKATSGLIEEE